MIFLLIIFIKFTDTNLKPQKHRSLYKLVQFLLFDLKPRVDTIKLLTVIITPYCNKLDFFVCKERSYPSPTHYCSLNYKHITIANDDRK